MSELRKATTTNPYFVTFTVVGWMDIFTREVYCKIILDAMEYCRIHKGLKIYSYVIMPSHIHAILQAESLADIIRDFKAHTARKIYQSIEQNKSESRREWLLYMFQYFAKMDKRNETYKFWESTNHPTEITDNSMFAQKEDYIHNNPVVAGLVTDCEFWRYSSACKDSYLNVDEA